MTTLIRAWLDPPVFALFLLAFMAGMVPRTIRAMRANPGAIREIVRNTTAFSLVFAVITIVAGPTPSLLADPSAHPINLQADLLLIVAGAWARIALSILDLRLLRWSARRH